MKRSIDLDLVPVTALALDDECPFTDCPDGRMVDDGCGNLLCTDCRTDALTVDSLVHEHRERVAS